MAKRTKVNGAGLPRSGAGIGLDDSIIERQKLLAEFGLPVSMAGWLRTKDVCTLMGYSRPWVLYLVKKKEILGQRSGYGKGKFLIDTLSVLNYMKARHVRNAT
jgi:hypothetical protein